MTDRPSLHGDGHVGPIRDEDAPMNTVQPRDFAAEKAELLASLDEVERQLGAIIKKSLGTFFLDNGYEPMSIQQARVNYGAGGLWLRNWIEKSDDV